MAVTYGFFDSVNGDRTYNADQMSKFYNGIVTSGVFQHVEGGLAVSAGSGMTVSVATGRAVVNNRWVDNSAALTLSIGAASSTYARIDAVVIKLSMNSRFIDIYVKAGEAASSPVAPTMDRADGVYEMALAYVNVAAGATSVTVTDKRSDSAVCGWASVAQATSGEVDQMLNDMKTGFDGVTYPSPAAMVQGCDALLQNQIDRMADAVYRSELTELMTWVPFHCIAGDNITIYTKSGANFTVGRFELKRADGTTDFWTLSSDIKTRTITISTGEEFFYARTINGTAQNCYIVNDSSYYNFRGRTATYNESVIDKGAKSNVDANTIIETGRYFLSGGTNHPSVEGASNGFLDVYRYSLDAETVYVVQRFIVHTSLTSGCRAFIRRSTYINNDTVTWTDWKEISDQEISIDNGIINAGDLNTQYNFGDYYALNCSNRPNATSQYGLISIRRYSLDTSTTYVIQTYMDMPTNKEYVRHSAYIQQTSPTWSAWAEVTNNNSLEGKKIVNFGDSIFGNWDDSTSISYNIAKWTNAIVYNVGFGGCRMSNYPTNLVFNAFSMCNLIDAIVDDDWTTQDTYAPQGPDYYVSRLARLKSIDFSQVDVVTIAYGCNDVTNSVLVDNENDPFDKNTYCGALRYTLKKFGENFPNIKIVVLPPIFEVYLESGVYSYDSDDPEYGIKRGFTIDPDRLFTDWVDGAMNVAKEYHTLSFDEYWECGFNKYNWETYYEDGTHLNEAGRIRRGERLAAKLKSVF